VAVGAAKPADLCLNIKDQPMKTNIGLSDRWLRLGLAAILLILAYLQVLSGIWQTVAFTGAAVLACTAAVRFCPLYTFFKINTQK